LLPTPRKVVDAGLRRHDDVGIACESVIRAAGIILSIAWINPANRTAGTNRQG
jgi:hypothetical protein